MSLYNLSVISFCFVSLLQHAVLSKGTRKMSQELLTEDMKHFIDSRWNGHLHSLANTPHDLDLYLTVLLVSVLQCQVPITDDHFQVDMFSAFLRTTQLVPSNFESDKLSKVYRQYKTQFDTVQVGQMDRVLLHIPHQIGPLFEHLNGKGCNHNRNGVHKCLYRLVMDQFVREYAKVCPNCLQPTSALPEWFGYLRRADLMVTVWKQFEVLRTVASSQKDPFELAFECFISLDDSQLFPSNDSNIKILIVGAGANCTMANYSWPSDERANGPSNNARLLFWIALFVLIIVFVIIATSIVILWKNKKMALQQRTSMSNTSKTTRRTRHKFRKHSSRSSSTSSKSQQDQEEPNQSY